MRIKQLVATLGMTVAVSAFALSAIGSETYLGSSGKAVYNAAFMSMSVQDGAVNLYMNQPSGCTSGIYMIPMNVPYSTSSRSVTGMVNISYSGAACTTPADQYAQLVPTYADGSYAGWANARNQDGTVTVPAYGGLFAKIGVSCGCTTRVRSANWR